MKISQNPPNDGPLGAFTLEAIRPVRDFTARKTLEQAHAFATGLTRIFADTDEASERVVRDLAAVGITAADAEQIAAQAMALIELMADRDHKADVFHAAVREAGQGERAMYERLAGIARLLRLKLGSRSPALAHFGVPPEGADEAKAKAKQQARSLFSAPITK